MKIGPPRRRLDPSDAPLGAMNTVGTMNAIDPDPDAITPAPPKYGTMQTVSAVPASNAASSSSGSRPTSDADAQATITRLSQTLNAENRFLLLPHEIMSLIFHFTDWPTARALRQSCSYLRTSFTVLSTIRKVRAHRATLLAADNGNFPAPCYRCVRVLPQDSFPHLADYRRASGNLYSRDYEWRRCTECLMCGGKMPAGVPYTWRGKKLVHCSFCGQHRTWHGRFNTVMPAQYCGRCRDLREIGNFLKEVAKSLQFWVALMGVLMAIFSAMSWWSIAKLWRQGHPYDHPVLGWAFFTMIYWTLVLILYLARGYNFYRVQTVAAKLLNSDYTVLELLLEWIAVVVSMCMPFAVREIATVPLLGWSTLSWAAAAVATLLRHCRD